MKVKVAGNTEVSGPSFPTLHETIYSLKEVPPPKLPHHNSSTANMPPPIPPPDEQEFDQPHLTATFPLPGLNAGNNLFWYFTNTPWFEPACNNIAVYNSVRLNDPSTAEHIMNDRKLWQERLDAIPLGTQFVLAGEGQGEGYPCLLQRQNKVEVTTKEGDDPHIETLVEGNYYTHGTKMLMAPSLLDIVQSRLVRLDEVDA